MGAGIPGTGMATLFYILSVFAMPLVETVRTVRGTSSWARWRLIARHLVIALTMTAAVYGTFRYLPGALLPPDATIGGVSALAVTVVLFVTYLAVVNLLAALVPGQLQLPEPRAFPDRRAVTRTEQTAPLYHQDRRVGIASTTSTATITLPPADDRLADRPAARAVPNLPSQPHPRPWHSRPAVAGVAVVAFAACIAGGAMIWSGIVVERTAAAPRGVQSERRVDPPPGPGQPDPGSQLTTRPVGPARLLTQHRIVTRKPLRSLTVRVRTGDADTFAPVIRRFTVTANGRVVASAPPLSPDSGAVTIRWDVPITVLHLRYVTEGGIVRSSPSSAGRALVLANPLAVQVPTDTRGDTVRLVDTEVLNAACTVGRRPPLPCGQPDDAGWKVRTGPSYEASDVFAQVNLSDA